MPEHEPAHAESLPRGRAQAPEGGLGERRVGLVLERGERARRTAGHRAGPDAPGEQDDAARMGVVELAVRRGQGERSRADAHLHGQPPLYGGWIASSSPGPMRPRVPRRYSPFRTKRATSVTGRSAG